MIKDQVFVAVFCGKFENSLVVVLFLVVKESNFFLGGGVIFICCKRNQWFCHFEKPEQTVIVAIEEKLVLVNR